MWHLHKLHFFGDLYVTQYNWMAISNIFGFCYWRWFPSQYVPTSIQSVYCSLMAYRRSVGLIVPIFMSLSERVRCVRVRHTFFVIHITKSMGFCVWTRTFQFFFWADGFLLFHYFRLKCVVRDLLNKKIAPLLRRSTKILRVWGHICVRWCFSVIMLKTLWKGHFNVLCYSM